MRKILLSVGLVLLLCGAEPLPPGLKPGQRPSPYSFNIATGPQRGQQFCFICDTAEKPAVIVFARKLSEPLSKLLVNLDTAVAAAPKDALRGWVTFLGEKSTDLNELALWSKKAGLKNLPLGIFDEVDGPPVYRLNRDAEVTVILFTEKKVTASFAFRVGELDDAAITKISREIPRLLEVKR